MEIETFVTLSACCVQTPAHPLAEGKGRHRETARGRSSLGGVCLGPLA